MDVMDGGHLGSCSRAGVDRQIGSRHKEGAAHEVQSPTDVCSRLHPGVNTVASNCSSSSSEATSARLTMSEDRLLEQALDEWHQLCHRAHIGVKVSQL